MSPKIAGFRVVLGWAYRGLTGGFVLLQNYSVAISVSPHVCFILVKCIYELGIFHANKTTMCLRNQGRTKGEGWSTANQLKPPSNFYCWPSKAALLFWFFGDFRCGALFTLYINIKIGKNSC